MIKKKEVGILPICPILLHAVTVKSTLVSVAQEDNVKSRCIGDKCICFMGMQTPAGTVTGNCAIVLIPMMLQQLNQGITELLNSSDDTAQDDIEDIINSSGE